MSEAGIPPSSERPMEQEAAMFVQVITGKVVDEDGFRRQGERWDTELRPGAAGFLGGTSGVTDDGRFVATARFDSAEAAQRNSERPEQTAWWQEMERFVSDVEFHNSTHVLSIFGGGSDDATFVQVMRGRVTNRATLDALEPRAAELESALHGFRPDVLGETIAYDEGGDGYSDIVYFTSEAEARENEKREPTGEAKLLLEQVMSAISVDEYFDLEQPRLI